MCDHPVAPTYVTPDPSSHPEGVVLFLHDGWVWKREFELLERNGWCVVGRACAAGEPLPVFAEIERTLGRPTESLLVVGRGRAVTRAIQYVERTQQVDMVVLQSPTALHSLPTRGRITRLPLLIQEVDEYRSTAKRVPSNATCRKDDHVGAMVASMLDEINRRPARWRGVSTTASGSQAYPRSLRSSK